MLDIDALGDYLRQNPGIMQDRARLQSILRDIFPQDKLTVNLLIIGFDEDIFSLVGKSPSNAELTKLANAIVDDYGVTRENANYIIETWLGVIFAETLPEDFQQNIGQYGAQPKSRGQSIKKRASSVATGSTVHHRHMSSSLTVADVREIFFRTKGRLMKKCKFERSGDMGTWDVVNTRSEKHYSRSLNQREKSLIIKRLGKGHYNEGDFAYIRTSTDMTLSWGVTYDSLIIAAKVDLVIPFADIDYTDSDRGLFTDTMTIFMKDGSTYELDENQMMSTPVHDNIEDLANFLNVVKDM